MIKIKNIYTGEILELTVQEILDTVINNDRSDLWSPYTEDDWQEGLDVFTEFEVIND